MYYGDITNRRKIPWAILVHTTHTFPNTLLYNRFFREFRENAEQISIRVSFDVTITLIVWYFMEWLLIWSQYDFEEAFKIADK